MPKKGSGATCAVGWLAWLQELEALPPLANGILEAWPPSYRLGPLPPRTYGLAPRSHTAVRNAADLSGRQPALCLQTLHAGGRSSPGNERLALCSCSLDASFPAPACVRVVSTP